MEKHRCKPSLTRCPLRGRNYCRPHSAGHKSSSDTHHDEEPVVRSSAYFYTPTGFAIRSSVSAVPRSTRCTPPRWSASAKATPGHLTSLAAKSRLPPATAPQGGQFVLHAKALHGNPYDG